MAIHRSGQSADLVYPYSLEAGEVRDVQAFWQDDDGKAYQRVLQVRAGAAGRYVVELRPLIEGAEQLDAEPCIFVIDVLPQPTVL